MVRVLNERFRSGQPDNDLSKIGILIHQFDSYDDGERREFPPWDRCTQPWSCYHNSDRMSAVSVMANSAHEHERNGGWPLFSENLAGIIFSPKHARVLCSYPYDAGTSDRVCNPIGVSDDGSCIPGCRVPGRRLPWCNEQRGWPCSWPPSHLKESLEVRERIAASGGQTWELDVNPNFVTWGKFYNEIVIEFESFHNALPESIDAIFYIDDGCADSRPQPWLVQQRLKKCAEYARWAHRKLQERWPVRAANIPLIKLDVHEWDTPFSL